MAPKKASKPQRNQKRPPSSARRKATRPRKQMTEAPQTVKALLEDTEKIGSLGVWEFDIDTRKQTWTDEVYRIHEVTREFEPTVDNGIAFYAPESRPTIERVVQLAIELGEPFDVKLKFITAKGNPRWVHAIGRPDLKNRRVHGFIQDITAQKEVERAFQESKERFDKTFQASPHPIGITEVATGRCIEVNDACLQLFGYRREEVIGNTTLMLGIWPKPEDRARLIEYVKSAQPVRNLELSFKTKSGDVRHILVSSDLAELNGTFCLITVGNDITARKQAEEALRRSEARFRTMAEAVPSFLFETNAAGWNTWTSKGWCLFTGQTPEQVTGHGWADALHPEDRVANLDQWLHCMEYGVPFEAKQRLRRVDGSYAWVIARALPVLDDDGTVTRWVGSVTDVDAVIQAEEQQRQLNQTLERRIAEHTEALRVSEERFRGVFEHAAEGIAITDLEGRFVQCNAAYAAIVGYTEQDLCSTQFESLVHPDDRLQNMEFVRRLMSGELPSFELENRYLTKSGGPAWVYKHVSMLRSEQGEPTYLLALVTDMTRRKQAEQLLQVSEAFVRDILDSLSAHICVLNQEGDIIQTNEAWKRFAQANSDQTATIGAVGDNYLEVCRRAIVSGDTTVRPILSGIEAVLAETQLVFSTEYPCHSPTKERWFLLRVTRLREASGVVLSHTDITERQQAEASLHAKQVELEQSRAQLRDLTTKLITAQEEERRRLARDLHDDITQRLAALTIDLGNLRVRECDSNESTPEDLEQLRERAKQLTTDVQRLSHELHPTILDHLGLEEAVREHVEEFAARTGLTTQVVTRRLPTTIPLQHATCLYRVLQESLQNIRKHANATSVLVRLLKTPQGVGLCVHDDGQGFEQAQETRKLRGMGLSSMAERVGILKGTFRVRTKPGDGTEIHASIPLESREAEGTGVR